MIHINPKPNFIGLKRATLKRKPPKPRKKTPQKSSELLKKPPKKRKPGKLDPLDILFSEFIRRRAIKRVGGCERCLTPKFDVVKDDGTIFPAWKSLQDSHFWGRTDKSTRWDSENSAGLCGGCHLYLEHHPHEHDTWFRQHLGETEFALLEARHRITYPKPDKKLLTIYYQQKIKELGIDNVNTV